MSDNPKFEEFVGQLADANLLYKVVQIFCNTDLSPEKISNHDLKGRRRRQAAADKNLRIEIDVTAAKPVTLPG